MNVKAIQVPFQNVFWVEATNNQKPFLSRRHLAAGGTLNNNNNNNNLISHSPLSPRRIKT